MVRALCAPSSGPANHRFAAPDDPAARPCRDQTHKRTGLDRSPAVPTCTAPANAVSIERNHGPRFASTAVLQHNPLESGRCRGAPNWRSNSGEGTLQEFVSWRLPLTLTVSPTQVGPARLAQTSDA